MIVFKNNYNIYVGNIKYIFTFAAAFDSDVHRKYYRQYLSDSTGLRVNLPEQLS